MTFKWNIDLEIQALRVYLRLLGHCSHLTGFASSHSIARSIHPLLFHYCHYCQQYLATMWSRKACNCGIIRWRLSTYKPVKVNQTPLTACPLTSNYHTIPRIWGKCPPHLHSGQDTCTLIVTCDLSHYIKPTWHKCGDFASSPEQSSLPLTTYSNTRITELDRLSYKFKNCFTDSNCFA